VTPAISLMASSLFVGYVGGECSDNSRCYRAGWYVLGVVGSTLLSSLYQWGVSAALGGSGNGAAAGGFALLVSGSLTGLTLLTSVAVVALARDPKAIQSCDADYSVCCA
jgi:hypothetical protein